MGTEEAANEAIDALNGKEVDGRTLRINKALPPQSKDRGGNGGGGRGGDRGGDRGGFRPRNDRY